MVTFSQIIILDSGFIISTADIHAHYNFRCRNWRSGNIFICRNYPAKKAWGILQQGLPGDKKECLAC